MKKLLLILLSFTLLAQAHAQVVRLVKDLNPGSPDGFAEGASDAGLLTSLDSVLIFIAYGKGNSRILCRSDAKSISTVPLVPPFASNETFAGWAVSDGVLWFAVNRPTKADLYSSDGTVAGTTLRHSSDGARFTKLRGFRGGVIFHKHIDPSDELLTYFPNGGTAPQNIRQFNPIAGGILDLAVVGDRFAFGIGATETGVTDRYLFRYDGQTSLFEKVQLLNTGNEFNTGIHMTPVGNRVFFFFQKNSQTKTLWTSDGTDAGTVQLKNMTTETTNSLVPLGIMADFGGKLVFRGKSTTQNVGTEIWISDGTPNGTTLLKDIAVGPDSGMPQDFTVWNGKLYFTALNGAANSELWATDGTTGGTQRVLPDFAFNEGHGYGLTVFNDSLAFGGFEAATGSELMMCKGNEASLHVVSNASAAGQNTFLPSNLMPAGKRLFFAAETASIGRELWVYEPYVKASSSTKQADFQQVLQISPNPGSDWLRVDLPESEAGLLRVFAADGRLFFQREITGKTTLETADWPQGMYHLQFVGPKTAAAGVWVK